MAPIRMLGFAAWLTAAAAVAAGCLPPAQCDVDADCVAENRCVSGQCLSRAQHPDLDGGPSTVDGSSSGSSSGVLSSSSSSSSSGARSSSFSSSGALSSSSSSGGASSGGASGSASGSSASSAASSSSASSSSAAASSVGTGGASGGASSSGAVSSAGSSSSSGGVAECGDGQVDGAEQCDDDNDAAGDGCLDCALEPNWSCTGEPSVCALCGDGTVNGTEACDDGANEDGNGCSAACAVEPSWACVGVQPSICYRCGDGAIGPTEACDDNNSTAGDGCSERCIVEPGWSCDGTPTACRRCGNSVVEAGEGCDDGETAPGDGCDALCAVEPGWVCAGSPSTCADCGDGLVREPETCDDANDVPGDGCDPSCATEPGFTCVNEPSECRGCGNGIIEDAEECDTANLAAQSCTSLGYLNGAGLGCAADCTFDVSGCGGPINSRAAVQNALSQARQLPGPDVVAIAAGTYTGWNTVDIDDTSMEGITLRGLAPGVELVCSGSGVEAIEIHGDNIAVEDLTFRNCGTAVQVELAADVVRLSRLWIINDGVQGDVGLLVRGDDVIVEDSRLEHTFPGQIGFGGVVITGDATNAVLRFNEFYGDWENVISAEPVQGDGNGVQLDHNSIHILTVNGPSTRDVIDVENRPLCARNNILYAPPAIAFPYASWDLVNVPGGVCPDGGMSTHNAVSGFSWQCQGASCPGQCPGPLCDVSGDPGFASPAAGLCLGVTSPLRDAAVDLGHDYLPDSPLRFEGAAPELGAREAGSSRVHGGIMTSSCP